VNRHPQLEARGMLGSVNDARFGEIKVPGDPVKFEEWPDEDMKPAPRLGEHTDEVLRDWIGLNGAEIADFRRKKTVF
jgi:CoA:oxalate CoA-transferase